MGQSITVTAANFDAVVLERSYQQPVLIDFYATWCGPCQLLKPLLEKLVQEYDFTLAKVDIDRDPQLAQTYQVEGVPDVRVVTQGQVLEGFVGVLPEAQIRNLLHQLGLLSTLEQELAALDAAQKAQDINKTKDLLTQLLTTYPDNPQILLAAARFYLNQEKMTLAQQYLDLIPPSERQYADQAEGLRGLLTLRATLASLDPDAPVDQQFSHGIQAALTGDYATALEIFLALVQQDRAYRQDGARKAMLTLFKLLGDSHPLTTSYRKQLMQSLY